MLFCHRENPDPQTRHTLVPPKDTTGQANTAAKLMNCFKTVSSGTGKINQPAHSANLNTNPAAN
ncbi:hypothetical protein LBMAG46_02360 [Planctomycetia bacterium]|nr:hypothetical protein LBMAG46_02360 [Planctomycetia bacterium]